MNRLEFENQDRYIERFRLAHQVECRHERIKAVVFAALTVIILAGSIYCSVLGVQSHNIRFTIGGIVLGLTSASCAVQAIFSLCNGYAQFVPPSREAWVGFLAERITPATVRNLSDDDYERLMNEYPYGALYNTLLTDPRLGRHLQLLSLDECIRALTAVPHPLLEIDQISDEDYGRLIERRDSQQLRSVLMSDSRALQYLPTLTPDDLRLIRPHIVHNLEILLQSPDLQNIGVEGFRLVPGTFSEDAIHRISQTFNLVERLENEGDIVSVMCPRTDQFISSRAIFDSIPFPEGVRLESNLTYREPVPAFQIHCDYNGERRTFTVDPNLWATKSEYFRRMLAHRLCESIQSQVRLEVPHEAFEVVVGFMRGEPLPPFNPDTISDLLFIANYLDSVPLREALAAQLADSNIDDESWRELFIHYPEIFPTIVRGMSLDRSRAILPILMPPTIPLPINHDLLIGQLNGLVPYRGENDSVLNSLIERARLPDFQLTEEFLGEIRQFNMIPPQLEDLLVILLNQNKIDIDDLHRALGGGAGFSLPLSQGGGAAFYARLSPRFFEALELLRLKFLRFHREHLLSFAERCPNIRSLYFPTFATPEWLGCLAQFPQLTELDLSHCQELTGDCLRCLERVPNLRTLSLADCRNLDQRSLAHLEHVPHLEKLNISRTRFLPDSLNYLQLVPHLRVLFARNCSWFPRDPLSPLHHVRELESLNVTFSPNIDSDTMRHVRDLPLLRLSVAHTSITDLDWLQLVPQLRLLDLTNTPLARNALVGLNHVLRLQALSVSTCLSLDRACLREIRQLQDLRFLNISFVASYFLENEESQNAILTHRGLQTVVTRSRGGAPQIFTRLRNQARHDVLLSFWDSE